MANDFDLNEIAENTHIANRSVIRWPFVIGMRDVLVRAKLWPSPHIRWIREEDAEEVDV